VGRTTFEPQAEEAAPLHSGSGGTKTKWPAGMPALQDKEAVLNAQDGLLILILATTYVPAQLPCLP
jgi:hypothetical protein